MSLASTATEQSSLNEDSNNTSKYSLESEDGLANRERDLVSREARFDAFVNGDIINQPAIYLEGCEGEVMYTTALTTTEHNIRTLWYFLTFGGLLTLIFDTIFSYFYVVTALIFTGLVYNIRDLFNDLWDETPDPNRPPFHWGGMIIVLILFNGFILVINGIKWLWETKGNEPKNRLKRLRRARFKYLEDKQREIDRFSRSYAFWYNDKDDPDIAITVFRNNAEMRGIWSSSINMCYKIPAPYLKDQKV